MTTKITGSVLANTAVTAGVYGSASTMTTFTVDAQGRLIAAANATPSIANTMITGRMTSTQIANTGVVAGSYGSGTTTPIITIDAQGRVTSATATTITGGAAGVGATTFVQTKFTATAGQTVFSVAYTVGYLHVYLNGVLLDITDYAAANGTSFTLSSGAAAGDILTAIAYTVSSVINVSPSPSGGSAGQVLYQAAANTTANTDVGTSGYLLTSAGTGKPTWTNPSTLAVSSAGSATTATTATTASTANALNTSNNYQGNSLGIGTAASGTAGEIRATNNITGYYSSDKKFKENVRDIPDALATVNEIGGKLFDWTDDYLYSKGGPDGYFNVKHDFGVIAQDVQRVFPIAVRTREDGTLAVDYEKLSALAFAAIVELTKKVEQLEGKIK